MQLIVKEIPSSIKNIKCSRNKIKTIEHVPDERVVVTITLGSLTLIYELFRALQHQKEHLIKRKRKLFQQMS